MTDYIKNILLEKIYVKVPICDFDGNIIGYLKRLSKADCDNMDLIEKFTDWRRKHMYCFLTWFKPTAERTKKWLEDVVLKDENRIFFKILDTNDVLIGHVGSICRKDCIEYDNFIREGETNIKSFAYYAAITFVCWLFNMSDTDFILVNCISSNSKALKFYERTGFKIHDKIPLRKIIKPNDEIRFVKDRGCPDSEFYNYEMRLYRKEFISGNKSGFGESEF